MCRDGFFVLNGTYFFPDDSLLVSVICLLPNFGGDSEKK